MADQRRTRLAGSQHSLRLLLVIFLMWTGVCLSRDASAYSVLAHEATVDSAWDDTIVPLLRSRFPGTPADRLRRARAYAYGGSVIQDLGYYPFGSHFFTNLVHYVRGGDFVEALIREARDIDEYAFALGALAHYTADTTGHPLATNRAIPLIYPKTRQKYGDEVIYAEDPKRHIMVEFAFDVVQVAGGAYLPDAYRDFIGFEVSRPVLERAFHATYGLELKELFTDLDLAIGTYRRAVSTTIPEMTRIAWREKREEIEKVAPGVRQSTFIYSMTRREYEAAFGTGYRKPGFLARLLVFFVKLLPKIGPLRALAFKVPTPEAERLFVDSFALTRERYRASLEAAGAGRLNLANADLDTGKSPAPGENALLDETYADLLEKLAEQRLASVPPALRRDIERYAAAIEKAQPRDRKARKRLGQLKERLAALTLS